MNKEPSVVSRWIITPKEDDLSSEASVLLRKIADITLQVEKALDRRDELLLRVKDFLTTLNGRYYFVREGHIFMLETYPDAFMSVRHEDLLRLEKTDDIEENKK